VPPPGVPVTIVTGISPAEVSDDAGTVAVSVPLRLNVVDKGVPASAMIDVGWKPVPVAVSVNDAAPTLALDGEMDVSDGTG